MVNKVSGPIIQCSGPGSGRSALKMSEFANTAFNVGQSERNSAILARCRNARTRFRKTGSPKHRATLAEHVTTLAPHRRARLSEAIANDRACVRGGSVKPPVRIIRESKKRMLDRAPHAAANAGVPDNARQSHFKAPKN